MALTIDELRHELEEHHDTKVRLRDEARPHLEKWVADTLWACRLPDGSITRESVRVTNTIMDLVTFRVLRDAWATDAKGLAHQANAILRSRLDIPNLLFVVECRTVPDGSIVFAYQY